MAGKAMAYVIRMEIHMRGSREGIKSGEVRLILIYQSTQIRGVTVSLFSIGWTAKIVSRKYINGRERIYKINVRGR